MLGTPGQGECTNATPPPPPKLLYQLLGRLILEDGDVKGRKFQINPGPNQGCQQRGIPLCDWALVIKVTNKCTRHPHMCRISPLYWCILYWS